MLSEIIRIIAILLGFAVKILYVLLLIRVILSWINPHSSRQVVDLIYKLTEPILKPLKVILHFGPGGLDLSPLIAMIILFLIEKYIIRELFILSSRL